MTKVYISPTAAQVSDDNGVGRVIRAQYAHLPAHGIELVDNPDHADVIAAHINADGLPRVDCLHIHGFYWHETPDLRRWHHESNKRSIEAVRKALAVTVPSEWVAMCFKRDMRLTPHVIGHGIDLDEWEEGENKGYVLWNKGRASDVCDPTPAYELAKRGIPVVTTFAPDGYEPLPNLTVTGTVPHAEMKELIRHAGAYLATTQETFGIGTLEAMACGVPILGYDWGGTADIVRHGIEGWLVKPHDIEGLEEGYRELMRPPSRRYAEVLRGTAQAYSWERVMSKYYAPLYHQVAEQRRREAPRVSIVITNYNYGAYLEEAIQSAVNQTIPPHEIIVVDDGSSDSQTESVLEGRDKDIAAVIHQDNQGVAAARNAGVRRATGNLITCLDADDRLHPDYIRLSLLAFSDRDIGIAYPRLRMLRDGQEPTLYDSFPPEFNWESQATPHNPPSNCITAAAMFRRDMWERAGGYVQTYAPGEDAEFWVRGLALGYKAVKSQAQYDYRVGHASASRTKRYKPVDTWHPWMRDKQFPMAAPQAGYPLVRSYSQPIVSVVIPVGPGHAQYLRAAIDSLLGQTFREWEAIVVDDTGEGISSDLLRPFPFLRIIRDVVRTSGAGAARNKGVLAASAPLVLFLDADDYLAPNALERMVGEYQRHEGKRYIYTDYVQFSDTGASPQRVADYNPLGVLETIETERGVTPRVAHAVTALVPTKWAEKSPFPDWLGWEEWGFYSELAIKGHCGHRLAEPLLYYRTHTGQRRETSIKHAPHLLEQHAAKYGDYLTGKKPMCGCGSSAVGQTIIGAQNAYRGMSNGNGKVATMQRLANGREGIRYTGNRQGGFRVQGVAGGRAYDNISTGWEAPIGDGAGEIHPADVQRFQGLPGFEYVPGVPAASPTVAHVEDVPFVPVPVDPEEEKRLAELREMRETDPASVPVDQSVLIDLEGIGPDLAGKLNAIGIYTLAQLSAASDETLLAVDGIGKRNLKTIRAQLTVS